MSAREIKQEEKPEEAKERFATWGFPLSGDWFYFGTVHHHCSMSAFQSSTDEQNEKGQDGLHITVGNIDKDHHDLHCRLYVGGVLFTCNMSSFWDIGEHLRDLLPKDLWDRVARHQMGYHNKESAFPERWKQNVTKLKRTYTSQTPTTYVGGYQSGPLTCGYSWLERIEKVISGVVAEAFDNNVGWEELDQMFQDLGSDPVYAAFMTLMEKYNVDYSDVERKWPKSEDEATKLAAQELTARAQAEAEGRKRGRKGKKGDKAEANGNGQITDVSAQASAEQEELDDWAKYTVQVYGED